MRERERENEREGEKIMDCKSFKKTRREKDPLDTTSEEKE